MSARGPAARVRGPGESVVRLGIARGPGARWKAALGVLCAVAAVYVVATVTATDNAADPDRRPGTRSEAAEDARDARVPPGVTAGIAVFDRRNGTFTERLDADRRFRSASVVKLLIVLDHLWDRGPDHPIPDSERERLDPMLRSSDDGAASHFWAANGQGAIVDRMVTRLGLTHTARPPATHPGYWGYTALTAADTVRIYRYLLDEAPAPVREYVMGNLREATRCATDGFDQYGGIPSAFERPWAVKQGWSGFGSSGECAPGESRSGGEGRAGDTGERRTARRAAAADLDLDLVSEALHTTGTVGADDRSIVAVFTLHPDGTPYGTAYSALTSLTGSLEVPGAQRPRPPG